MFNTQGSMWRLHHVAATRAAASSRVGQHAIGGVLQEAHLQRLAIVVHSPSAMVYVVKCSENVNDFVRKMRNMHNMQISVCLCGKSTYV
jgi:hypothetical protein